ncbi:hypothetical protein AB0442_13005 [Kitasatospora sp. NPDC085895]|uniref:hypothetical protein n=1 Tax=Kitasatospora sp. NPDC085895 TaxID=3155057 RepID=UPI0034502A6A
MELAAVHRPEPASRACATSGAGTAPTDPGATAAFLGHYEGGYRLIRQGLDLSLHLGPRILPLGVLPDGTYPDGTYVVTTGLLVGNEVRPTRGADGTPLVEVVGFETVRRTVGLP